MSSTTQESLRTSCGWSHNRTASLYLPRTFLNGDYVLPGRDASLLSKKVGGVNASLSKRRGAFIPERIQAKLVQSLCTDLGLSKRMSQVFLSRKRSTIERVEEEVKGIIDALLLFDSRLFIEGCENHDLLFTILRKVISIGAFDVDDVTSFWKEFSNYVWVTASRSTTLEPATLRVENPFKRILRHSLFRFIEAEGIRDKRDAERLAHLCNSRQLVAGGHKTMKIAMRKFIETTSTPFELSSEEIDRARWAAYRVGRKIKLLEPDLPRETAHISLSGAGSFSKTVKDGGRAQEIIEDISLFLKYVPLSDTTHILPGGLAVRDHEGKPRWTTWCRDTPIDPLGEFGEIRSDMTLMGEYDRRWGFDEALGDQIFACALWTAVAEGHIDSEGRVLEPIPARSICVPEPGGKSRIVTTTTWWNIILQQPTGHVLKKVLERHPSAVAGLQRADQAWLYIDLLRKATVYDDCYFLSSDLEEATDATPQALIEPLVRGFCAGFGLAGPYIDIALNLAKSDRYVFVDSEDLVFTKKRGALMGEPLTKAILTILNLSCEEAAIRDYLMMDRYDGPVQVPWRAFAVGGDDHIAVGPRDYLERITRNHIAWGSKISKTKHAISRVAVRYCEKVLYLKEGTNFKIPSRLINESLENYESSCFVDSVKIRLLSPISKSMEVQNDRNIAIGKAKSLGRTLRWLNPSIFDRKWVEMVRQRFVRRMKHYLPKEGTSLFYQIMLPQELGGLDLYLSGEFDELYDRVPLPTKQYMAKLLSGEASMDMMRKFKTFTSNSIERGFDFKSNYAETIEAEGFGIEGFPVYEVRDQLGLPHDVGLRYLLKELSKRGWETFDTVLRTTLRGVLFEEILKGSAEVRKYSTTPWKKRYSLLWDRFYDSEYNIPIETRSRLKEIENVSRFLPLLVYDVNQLVDSFEVVDGQFRMTQVTFLEDVTQSLPNLKLSYKVYGEYGGSNPLPPP
jgi:hypothetical protein